MNVKRFFIPPKQSYFLFGPRGTGKSTWIKETYPDSIYIDLLLADAYRLYSGNPERLINILEAEKDKKIVVLDEIQKIPDLLPIVHAVIEQKKGFQFILTGSSARKLKRAGVDLLAGRALKKAMHPFMAAELDHLFSLEKALKVGMLPIVWDAEEAEDVLHSYVDLYIREEVQYEGLVRKIGDFSRFLTVMAFSHANIVNLCNIARECEVKRSTVDSYIEILQDLLLGHLLLPFTKRAQRHLSTHPKFYFFDAGIFRVLRGLGPFDTNDEVDGAAIEGLVLQHLRAWCDYSKGKYELYFWRTKSGLEVDFIIYGEYGFWAIEVKNNKRVYPGDVKPLVHFIEDFPECKPLLLYRGKEKIMEKGILCLPCEDFLRNIIPNNPLT